MTDNAVGALEAGGWLSRRMSDRPARQSGPLAGLTYVAKDLFDVAGLSTLAGSPSNLNDPAARQDAQAIRCLDQAGAQMVALSNMDPLAYGFVTNNPLYGPARNPRDLERSCGGSSGGSAGAVASGLVDFALGTDTSGSIRVPAAFTGLFGLKPTLGLFSADGVAPLSPTFDRVGLFARSAEMLKTVSAVLAQGRLEDSKGLPTTDLKIGVLGGHFATGMDDDVAAGVHSAYDSIGAVQQVELPGSARARAAAYILVAHEAAQTHADKLLADPGIFDKQTRARLIAASAIDPAWIDAARAYQQAYEQRLAAAFEGFDFLLAPTVPCVAPLLSELERPTTDKSKYLRATLGLYTQPMSLTGYPVVSVPIDVPGTSLPTALQVIARPGWDRALLEYAAGLPPLMKSQ